MGLFDQLRRKRASAEVPADPTERERLGYFLSGFLGTAALRQIAFGNTIAGCDWDLDLEAGILSFGPRRHEIEVLGTESAQENSWLWGHANTSLGNRALVRASEELHRELVQAGFPMLRPDVVPLDDLVTGHNLSSVAVAMREHCCYYRCPVEGGSVNVFVLVKQVQDYVFQPARDEQILSVIPQLIQSTPLNHRVLLEAVFQDNGMVTLTGKDGSRTGITQAGNQIVYQLDAADRLVRLELRNG